MVPRRPDCNCLRFLSVIAEIAWYQQVRYPTFSCDTSRRVSEIPLLAI